MRSAAARCSAAAALLLSASRADYILQTSYPSSPVCNAATPTLSSADVSLGRCIAAGGNGFIYRCANASTVAVAVFSSTACAGSQTSTFSVPLAAPGCTPFGGASMTTTCVSTAAGYTPPGSELGNSYNLYSSLQGASGCGGAPSFTVSFASSLPTCAVSAVQPQNPLAPVWASFSWTCRGGGDVVQTVFYASTACTGANSGDGVTQQGQCVSLGGGYWYKITATTCPGPNVGAIVAAIVTPILVGLLLICLCVWYCRRRRKAQQVAGALASGGALGAVPVAAPVWHGSVPVATPVFYSAQGQAVTASGVPLQSVMLQPLPHARLQPQ